MVVLFVDLVVLFFCFGIVGATGAKSLGLADNFFTLTKGDLGGSRDCCSGCASSCWWSCHGVVVAAADGVA